MKVLFQASIPKKPHPDDENEDIIKCDEDNNIYALCDGGSESFAPREWAEDLARAYIANQTVNPEWLEGVIAEHRARFDPSQFTWSQQIAFSERGSFSTLLGLSFSEDNSEAILTAIGDSLVVHIKEDKIAKFPYSESQQFTEQPTLVATNPDHNEPILTEDGLATLRCRWTVTPKKNEFLLLMTDALGQYFLKRYEEKKPIVRFFTTLLKSETDFADFVTKARKSENLRNDDTTLLVFQI